MSENSTRVGRVPWRETYLNMCRKDQLHVDRIMLAALDIEGVGEQTNVESIRSGQQEAAEPP